MLVSFSHTSSIKIGRDGLSIHLCVTEKKWKTKSKRKQNQNDNAIRKSLPWQAAD